MKNRLLAAAILILPLALFIYFWCQPEAVKNSPAGPDKLAQDAAVASALAKQNPATVALIESNFARVQPQSANTSSGTILSSPVSAGPPAPLQFTNFSPAIVLENMSRAVRQYGAMFGGNPVGTYPEIASQLSGNNPRHINFLNAEAGMRVNENGELVDPWGRPYFFHQLSGHEMEIRSAGADGRLWTPDDLVAR
jgi:hypothetical protein